VFYTVVETPRGSLAKLEFDPKLGAFTLAKPLLAGLTYPYDWGFLPSTRAEDGDPLDVLIIHDAATYPGLVLKCKPIGVLEAVQTSKGKKERNDRVFVVPDRSPFEGDLQDIRRLPSRAIEELEKFFEATDALESKKSGVPGVARSRQGHQDDKEACALGGAKVLLPQSFSASRFTAAQTGFLILSRLGRCDRRKPRPALMTRAAHDSVGKHIVVVVLPRALKRGLPTHA
jgi:inorganic pyrophosphatase